jgi:7-cyano-7-deazaguanine reductase
MKSIPLGKTIKPSFHYNPKLLFPIQRDKSRKSLDINDNVFNGYDTWNIYELSWLNNLGKPEVRIVQIVYSCKSKNIVESKSLKLYFSSFNMTRFTDENEVKKIIEKDLNKILETLFLKVNIFKYNKKIIYSKIPKNLLIDDIPIKIKSYKVNSSLLKINNNNNKIVERYSNLLRTNCPITNQPDWATVYIKYKSNYKLDDKSLLSYIISYREHSDFHESCCERIFNDIYSIINPSLLIVKCFYTRRGGIDINPARFFGIKPDNNFDLHYWRQ